jgi:hypothetical protein
LPNGGYLGQISAAYDALAGRAAHSFVADPDAAVRSAVASVAAQLSKEFGTTDMTKWRRPFPTEPFTAIGVISPPPVVGMDHGSYSQIVDPRAGVGENVEPPGNLAADSATASAQLELGGPPPPHFEDQRALYQSYKFKPMRMGTADYRADPEAVLHVDDGGSYGADITVPYAVDRDACRGPSTLAIDTGTHGVLPPTGGSGAVGLALVLLALAFSLGHRRVSDGPRRRRRARRAGRPAPNSDAIRRRRAASATARWCRG